MVLFSINKLKKSTTSPNLLLATHKAYDNLPSCNYEENEYDTFISPLI